MKTWNAPEFQELDVRLTASGNEASIAEAGGYLDSSAESGWRNPTYNSATHEYNNGVNGGAGCVSPIKTSTAS